MSQSHTIKRVGTIPLLHNGEHREPLRVRIYLA